jgi:hypothetical protein
MLPVSIEEQMRGLIGLLIGLLRGLNAVRLDLMIKGVATTVAGLWIYFIYRRDTRARLQLRLFARRAFRDGLEFLTIKTELSNVGPSRVRLDNDGCAIEISAYKLPTEFDRVMGWLPLEPCCVVDLYDDQEWVEASGLLIDQRLVALKNLADRDLRIQAIVTSTRRPRLWSLNRIQWRSTLVVVRLSREPAVKNFDKER